MYSYWFKLLGWLVLASLALAGTLCQVKDLKPGKAGYVGTWYFWAENPKEMCLNADGDVLSERTSWAMMWVEHHPDGYWVRFPEHFSIEFGDDIFDNKVKGQCIPVAGLLD